MDVSFLPDDLVLDIALFQSISELVNVFLISRRFNLIGENPNFWRQKFLLDFGFVNSEYSFEVPAFCSWKSLYQNSGKLFVFGLNDKGQLGLGDTQSRVIPIELPHLKARSISCGENHSMIIDCKNNVWAFGSNVDGQLGLGDNDNRFTPTQIPNIKTREIACGDYHTMIIDMNNKVWTFGNNARGQLGLGLGLGLELDSYGDIKIPTQIPNIQAQYIFCGCYHSMIIDFQNNIWVFGDNRYGQLGLGLRDEGDDVDEDSLNIYTPIQLPNIQAKAISCGYSHTILIDLDNNVWSFGDNEHGELGLGDTQARYIPTHITNMKAIAISGNSFHSMIIDMNNNVWVFGYNEFGQLGLGDKEDRYNPTQIPNIQGKEISCGDYHSMIIDLKNNLWAFGGNVNGELGLGDIQKRLIPVQIPNIKAQYVYSNSYHTIIRNF